MEVNQTINIDGKNDQIDKLSEKSMHEIIQNASNELESEFNIEESAIKESCMENASNGGESDNQYRQLKSLLP